MNGALRDFCWLELAAGDEESVDLGSVTQARAQSSQPAAA